MAFPSRVLGSGQPGATATAVCGDVATGLTAAGTNAATALVLSAVHNVVATAAASTGVRLPPAEVGAVCTVANDGANSLTVYPASGTIDGAASVAIATTKRRLFVGTSPTTWVSILGA